MCRCLTKEGDSLTYHFSLLLKRKKKNTTTNQPYSNHKCVLKMRAYFPEDSSPAKNVAQMTRSNMPTARLQIIPKRISENKLKERWVYTER